MPRGKWHDVGVALNSLLRHGPHTSGHIRWPSSPLQIDGLQVLGMIWNCCDVGRHRVRLDRRTEGLPQQITIPTSIGVNGVLDVAIPGPFAAGEAGPQLRV